ncbi:MAG: PIN domain-containing protein [Solirubrobacterales bacterium]|nr:PIN domain-containing protein [Solirubrobacterales bacterium]
MGTLALLDTSVLIANDPLPDGWDAAISTVTLGELHFGLLVAKTPEAQSARASRLGQIQTRFPDALPLDEAVAREWGALQAAVRRRGGNPRGRMADLAIAATSIVHGAVLLTRNLADFALVADLVNAREP